MVKMAYKNSKSWMKLGIALLILGLIVISGCVKQRGPIKELEPHPEIIEKKNESIGGEVSGGGPEPHPEIVKKKDEILESVQEWLDAISRGDVEAPSSLINCTAGEPVLVYTHDLNPALWLIPIKNREGFYVGSLRTYKSFELPGGYTLFAPPYSKTFLSRSKNEAIQYALHAGYKTEESKEKSIYTIDQISEPFLVLDGSGWFWYIEVKSDEHLIEKFYYNFWSFD